MSSQRVRRITATAGLAAAVAAIAWVVGLAARSTPLSNAARLPQLAYRDATGAHRISAVPGERTLIMVFHSKCGHCAYQLTAFNRRVAELSGARVYLLTTEHVLPVAELERQWPALSHAPSVTWGQVSSDDVKAQLRTLATPAFFVFDERGRLIARYVGETKLDLLLTVLSAGAGAAERAAHAGVTG